MARNKVTSIAFWQSFKKLTATWPIDNERQTEVAESFQRIWQEYGSDRFVKGVIAITQNGEFRFFPTPAEFKGYIPDPSERRRYCGHCADGWLRAKNVPDANQPWVIHKTAVYPCPCRATGEHQPDNWDELRRADRKLNPDKYFGEADVVSMIRIAEDRKAKKLPSLDSDDMIAAVIETRKPYTDAREARP